MQQPQHSPGAEAIPLAIRFSAIMEPPTENPQVFHMLTQTTCGPNNQWDDSDIGSHSQRGEYD